MIQIKFNQALGLEDEIFINQEHNIDYLIKQFNNIGSLNKRKVLIDEITRKCDKFHSYFHYETSFLHLKYFNSFIFYKKINILIISYNKFFN